VAAYVKYQIGVEVLAEAQDAGADSWRLILSNTAPNVATDTTAVSASELGGVVATVTSSAQSAGVYKLVLAAPASPTWTGSGGGFTFRYVILYNLTQTQCIGYWDYGSSVLVSAGEFFTPTLDASGGTYTIT
jgi:hypothetical protein